MEEAIFRKSADSAKGVGKKFTVNASDKLRRLDISLYDSKMLPSPHLSWTNNKEFKIKFEQDGSANTEMPPHFLQFLREKKIPNEGLIINPHSHGLILRLAFLQTTEVISNEEINDCFRKISHVKPCELLAKELHLPKLILEEADEEIKKNHIKENLNKFIDKHNLDNEKQQKFLQNLLNLIEKNLIPNEENLTKNLLKTSIEEMVNEIENRQPSLLPQGLPKNPEAEKLSLESRYK